MRYLRDRASCDAQGRASLAQNRDAHLVALTGYEYSKGSYILTRNIWVTAVPEVKNKCQGAKGNLALWLRELLGLHPDSEVTHFAVIEVKKDDIFLQPPIRM